MRKLMLRLSALMLIAIMGFGMSSCTQETNKVSGKWSVIFNGDYLTNTSLKYSFDGNNKFSIAKVLETTGETEVTNGNYNLNWINQTIVFSQEGKSEEYKIINLSSDTLQLEKVCKKGNPHDIISLKKS